MLTLTVGLALALWAGAAHAGDEPWDGEVQYGDGQVGPGTGGDWRPLQTCWRVINEHHRDISGTNPVYGTDYDWAFCHEVEDASGDPFCEIDPNAFLDEEALFSIFLGDYQRVLRETGANVISMVDPHESGYVSSQVYRREFGEPSAVPGTNRFVPKDRFYKDNETRASLPNLPDGPGYENDNDTNHNNHSLVFQSREHYLRDLYYSRPNGTGGVAWYLDIDHLERIPARETPRFFIRWQHPDHPMGGLMTDYAYVLQQQNYLNAQLLGNVRSYDTDGHRVVYKVQSKEAVLLHGQQVGNCGTPGGTVHPHPSTCTLTGTITSHRVVYPSTIALSYDYNPAPPRFGATPTPFVTATAPQNDPPVRVPLRGDHLEGLTGTKLPAPHTTPVFQHRQAFDAGLPRPVATNAPTAPPGFVGEQVHVPEYTYYDVSRVGTYDYPYYGVWGIPWEDFGVDYHRELKEYTDSAIRKWGTENLVDPEYLARWNISRGGWLSDEVSPGEEWPNTPAPTRAWYLDGTRTPTPQYEHVANIGVPTKDPRDDPYAPTPAERLHSHELGNRYYESHNARQPYPTPDQLIFSDGPARQVENPFIIRDYPNTSLDAISIEMEMPRIYREDVFLNYSETDDLLEEPILASRYGGEYASPLFTSGYSVFILPKVLRTDAVTGYQQFRIPVEQAPGCSAGGASCAYHAFGSDPLRPGPHDVRGHNLANEYPNDGIGNWLDDTASYKWPVFFDDMSWYLFELHGVNKALADSDKFAEAVLDRNPFTGTTHYPAWALDPRMVGRPYDGMGHPVANRAPISRGHPSEERSVIPDIPHRYYGGGLANYRNTVDPLEHRGAVEAMAGVVNSLGEGFPNFRLTSASDTDPHNHTNVADTDGYGLYTNRKVHWSTTKYAGFDGDNAGYADDDFGDGVYDSSRDHNLTFLPLKPTPGYEPGGTLVKRGVSSPMDDGTNSNFQWIVHDSSPLQVYGGNTLSTYQTLGMPMPGSYNFGKSQYQWPDFPLDPNRTYLLATMYYEASFLSPFYIVRDPTGPLGTNRYDVLLEPFGRGPEIVGRVPRMVMRPVFCRVLIQPLGVNTGPGAKSSFHRVSPLLGIVDDWSGGWISSTITGVKEKTTEMVDKAKEFVENLNPIQWFTSMLSKGMQGVAEKSATGVCKAGNVADYVAGSSEGEMPESQDLDSPQASSNTRSRTEAVQRCREVEQAQQAEAQACPEGAADGGTCGVVPEMVITTDPSGMRPYSVSADNTADFGGQRGFYERPHYVDDVRMQGNIDRNPTRLSPGPLQFGYFAPGENFALPQKPFSGGPPGKSPNYSGEMDAPAHGYFTTRCPTEWEIDLMKEGATAPRWGGSSPSEPWTRAVKAHKDAHYFPNTSNPRPVPLSGDWESNPPYLGSPPDIGEEDLWRVYNNGLCAPMYVTVGCDAGPDGQCPNVTSHIPWASGANSRSRLVSLPIRWELADTTSGSAMPHFFEIEITSESSLYGRADFNSSLSNKMVQGGGLLNSRDFLLLDPSPRPTTYVVPATWRQRTATTPYEYIRHNYTGFAFGTLLGPSILRPDDVALDYERLCALDMPGSGACPATSARGDYFTRLGRLPSGDNDIGIDPQGFQDPIRDYDTLVNDLTTVYAMGPGASYTIRIRGILEESGGRTVLGPWSNTLTLDAASLCGTLNEYHDQYDNLRLGLGCDVANLTYGVERFSQATTVVTNTGTDWLWRMVATDVCTGFFDSTPARLTWGVDGVIRGWGMMWVVSMAALVILIFWQGIRMTYDMWMHGGWANQRDPGFREAVPRFFLALLLAAASLLLCRLFLILISNVSCYVAQSSGVGIWTVLGGFLYLLFAAILTIILKGSATAVLAASTVVLSAVALAILVAMLSLIIMLVGFFLMLFARVLLQLLIRVAMLAVLIVISPLAFVLMATPDTEQWTHKWLGMFSTMAITQTLQLTTLYLAAKVFDYDSVSAPNGIPMWTGLIVGIVILYMVGKIPEILDRYLGQAVVSGGSAPGMVNQGVQGASRGLEQRGSGGQSTGGRLAGRLGFSRMTNPSSS